MGIQSAPSISVVIPTWNAATFVEKGLRALFLQEKVSFEILVVDNGVVNQETAALCAELQREFAGLRYLAFEKQLGYAGAVNAGVMAANHDLIAVINNDNIPSPTWLLELRREYERARAEGKEAVISSLVDRPDFPDPLGAAINIWGRYVRAPERPKSYIPFHPDGSAFLFSKKAFGLPYDPDYFIYHEDVFLGWRAWLMGHEVRLAPLATAITFDGGSTRRIKYLTAFYTERNRWLNYFTFLSIGSLVRLFPLLFLDLLLKLLAGSHRKAKFHAWGWILSHPRTILAKRSLQQAKRARPDSEILALFSFHYADGRSAAPLNFFFGLFSRCLGWGK